MSNGEQARKRAQELARQLAEPRRPRTNETVDRAAKRAEQSRERSRQAHLSAAAAHERAALAHDQAIANAIGDVDHHREAAARHRAARDADYHAAELDE